MKSIPTVFETIFSLGIWVLLMATRAIPAAVIALMRQGDVELWLLVSNIILGAATLIFGQYIGFLRSAYYANEYNQAVADPIRAQIARYAPLNTGVIVAYTVTLILLAIV